MTKRERYEADPTIQTYLTARGAWTVRAFYFGKDDPSSRWTGRSFVQKRWTNLDHPGAVLDAQEAAFNWIQEELGDA